MNTVYVEAYDPDGNQLLGNGFLQGKIVIANNGDYRESLLYKSLIRIKDNLLKTRKTKKGYTSYFERIGHFLIVDTDGKQLEKIEVGGNWNGKQ